MRGVIVPNKLIEFDLKGLEKIKVGLDKAADAIKSTLGPSGRTVIIGMTRNRPKFTKDGVTVARAIQFEDPFENAGAQIIIEAAEKTLLNVGDGTTTTAIMAQNLFTNGLQAIQANKQQTSQLMRELSNVTQKILKKLCNNTQKVKGVKDKLVKQIATISTNNDEQLGTLIADAFKQAGNHGVLFIEEGKSTEDKIEVKDGIEIKAGWVHPAFINKPSNSRCEFDGSYVIISEDILADETQLMNLVERIWKKGQKPITIIARGFTDPVLGFLLVNRIKSNYTYPILAVKINDLGMDTKEMIRDFADMFGIHPVSNELNVQLDQLEIKDLLWADKISASRKSITILAQSKNKAKLKGKIVELKNRLKEEDDPFQKSELENRIGVLAGKVVTLQVGGKTRMEISEKRDRVDDAASAVKSALEFGIVPGGGIVLFNIAQELPLTDAGMFIRDMLVAPIRQLCINAGLNWEDCGGLLLNNYKTNPNYGIDFGALENLTLINYIKEGIVDPVNALKESILNAVSVSKLLLNSSAVIVDDVVKETERSK